MNNNNAIHDKETFPHPLNSPPNANQLPVVPCQLVHFCQGLALKCNKQFQWPFSGIQWPQLNTVANCSHHSIKLCTSTSMKVWLNSVQGSVFPFAFHFFFTSHAEWGQKIYKCIIDKGYCICFNSLIYLFYELIQIIMLYIIYIWLFKTHIAK